MCGLIFFYLIDFDFGYLSATMNAIINLTQSYIHIHSLLRQDLKGN